MNNWLLENIAHAQELIFCPDGTLADPAIGCVGVPAAIISPESSVLSLILTVVNYVATGAVGFTVLFLTYGAIRYILAAGDPERIDQAKRTIFWSITGLVISLLSIYIVQFVMDIIG
ncbi:MAG: hypothetical protein V1760_01360 [Candidatus Peregrinibacteria bacterium]